jgi:hypothetical protein
MVERSILNDKNVLAATSTRPESFRQGSAGRGLRLPLYMKYRWIQRLFIFPDFIGFRKNSRRHSVNKLSLFYLNIKKRIDHGKTLVDCNRPFRHCGCRMRHFRQKVL